MKEAAVRRALLPLHERLRGRPTLRCYTELRRNDARSPDEIARLQQSKLRSLLVHCFRNVPFYQRRFSAVGITSPEHIALDGVPPLERADVREHLANLAAVDRKRALIRHSTGGSSGNPLVFYTDIEKESWHNAHKLRCRAWHGVLPGSRQADLWGSPIELDARSTLRKLKDRWLLEQIVLPARGLDDRKIAQYIARLARFAPRLLYGYPTVIDRLARHLEERPDSAGRWRPELVVCTSEMLYEDQRARIGRAFGCRVANEYGSRDGGFIAHECVRGRLHIVAEHVVVEVDEPDAQGIGDLLITNLDGYGMPFVRYRIGDRGRLGTARCDCGLPLPVLEKLDGRSSDFLVGRARALVHSSNAVYLFHDLPDIVQFRIEQDTDLSLDVALVAREPLSDVSLQKLRSGLRRLLDLDVDVDFVYADAILPEASGKYRRVVSKALDAGM